MISEVGLRVDRRSARRDATRAEIVAAAWDLARVEGLAGLSMRELGARVGMKAQSLYSYFASKHEIYDAMFADGYRALVDATADTLDPDVVRSDPIRSVRIGVHAFFSFCTNDPVRHQLLFQRTIPGFEPSPESWAIATGFYDRFAAALAAVGITEPAGLDLWTAVVSGLISQQIANDPGGDRWEDLVDRAIDMLFRELVPRPPRARSPRSRT